MLREKVPSRFVFVATNPDMESLSVKQSCIATFVLARSISQEDVYLEATKAIGSSC
jgi:hypothetical protein